MLFGDSVIVLPQYSLASTMVIMRSVIWRVSAGLGAASPGGRRLELTICKK